MATSLNESVKLAVETVATPEPSPTAWHMGMLELFTQLAKGFMVSKSGWLQLRDFSISSEKRHCQYIFGRCGAKGCTVTLELIYNTSCKEVILQVSVQNDHMGPKPMVIHGEITSAHELNSSTIRQLEDKIQQLL
jgi:hypothetical protein